ncbi:MAG TPA: outer membrane beta-barrel protein [Patescibacteria group bacterium]|nr:outer membrane beta-barrel protein [Patescibacteria group bacterium]
MRFLLKAVLVFLFGAGVAVAQQESGFFVRGNAGFSYPIELNPNEYGTGFSYGIGIGYRISSNLDFYVMSDYNTFNLLHAYYNGGQAKWQTSTVNAEYRFTDSGIMPYITVGAGIGFLNQDRYTSSRMQAIEIHNGFTNNSALFNIGAGISLKSSESIRTFLDAKLNGQYDGVDINQFLGAKIGISYLF